jgi:hypothetical protein
LVLNTSPDTQGFNSQLVLNTSPDTQGFNSQFVTMFKVVDF